MGLRRQLLSHSGASDFEPRPGALARVNAPALHPLPAPAPAARLFLGRSLAGAGFSGLGLAGALFLLPSALATYRPGPARHALLAESRNSGREAEPFTASPALTLSASLPFSVSGLRSPAVARSLFMKVLLWGGRTMPSRRQIGTSWPSFLVRPILAARGSRLAAPFGRRSLERGEAEQRMTANRPAIAEHAAEMPMPARAAGIKCVQTSRGGLFTETGQGFDGGVPPVHAAVAVFSKRIALPAGRTRRLRDGARRLDGPADSKGDIA